uniref:Interleukin n=1 Tax=Xiphophorus maculatus TaxID=8083 RepID=A0A3B5PXS9_XIPMA
MKLVAFCLLALCCCTLAMPAPMKTSSIRKLRETLFELRKFNDTLTSMDKTEKRVNMLPKNTEQECGCLSALKCFEEGVSTFSHTMQQIKLFRSLRNKLTISGLQFCAKDSTPSCSECKTHPTESVDEFLNQLESLLQMVKSLFCLIALFTSKVYLYAFILLQ